MYAVLTGDIVGSSKMSDKLREQTFSRIRKQLEFVQQGKTAYPLSIYRGDSWQILLDDPKDALRLTLLIRTALLMGDFDGNNRADTRVSIGIGTVDKIDPEDVTLSYGEAFTLSGHNLEAMKKKQRMAFAAPALTQGDCITGAVIPLLDVLIDKLTAKQARAMNGALRGLLQQEIAKECHITQQTAKMHLDRAGWIGVGQMLHTFNDEIQPPGTVISKNSL